MIGGMGRDADRDTTAAPIDSTSRITEPIVVARTSWGDVRAGATPRGGGELIRGLEVTAGSPVTMADAVTTADVRAGSVFAEPFATQASQPGLSR